MKSRERRPAGALAGHPADLLREQDRPAFASALAELESSFRSRQDDWPSRYNLGNLYSRRRQSHEAVRPYLIASKLGPGEVLPPVNASIAYANLEQAGAAEHMLLKALALDPGNAAANFNLGLLKAELGDPRGAEEYPRIPEKGNLRVSRITARSASSSHCSGVRFHCPRLE